MLRKMVLIEKDIFLPLRKFSPRRCERRCCYHGRENDLGSTDKFCQSWDDDSVNSRQTALETRNGPQKAVPPILHFYSNFINYIRIISIESVPKEAYYNNNKIKEL